VLAAVPNVLPLVFTYGAMGWLSIPLNISTGMVPCVLIGLVVDDTIHALFRYRDERRRIAVPALAVRRMLRHVGRAVVSTALVLCAGMGVLTFSSFRMIVQFGQCMVAAVVSGVAIELLLTPALLASFPGLLSPRSSRPDGD
jgi:predicted RND superfamily exporter protein